MRAIVSPPKLVAQVHDAIVAEIARGALQPGERIIQEQLADELGVSRQPVQQALLLLHTQGVLQDAPGRGLIVAPLDPQHVRNMYDVRAMLEGLAFRRAAEHNADCLRRIGPGLLKRGREALAGGSVADMIDADLEFHHLIHELSKNPLIASTMEPQWIYTQRVMGEALTRNGTPHQVWDEHEAMLDVMVAGDGNAAEVLARRHVEQAAAVVLEHLETQLEAAVPPVVAPAPLHPEFRRAKLQGPP